MYFYYDGIRVKVFFYVNVVILVLKKKFKGLFKY